ncbi:hypothetical protein, partial [Pseudomonas syringae group genomosp. 7]|uniref:hypothetical protein n=1 Tax=Pseudomonas syringae group genomosp. 7 TaxID=251699 RepID=UPI00376FDDFF
IVQPVDGPFTDYPVLSGKLAAVPGIKMALPLVEGQVLASAQAGGSTGALVRGARAEDLTKLKTISDDIKSGDMVGYASGEGVLIGTRMADQH